MSTNPNCRKDLWTLQLKDVFDQLLKKQILTTQNKMTIKSVNNLLIN
jgi:hypothetical protein